MRLTVDGERILWTPAMIEASLDQCKVRFNASSKEARINCPFCHDEGRPSLYVNLGDKPGIWHCFKCEAGGSFTELLRKLTGWTTLQALTYNRQMYQTYKDCDRLIPESLPDDRSAEDKLAPYRFRHPYLFERKLEEPTLLRYEVGYDRTNMEITFPWFDPHGTLVAIKHRAVARRAYYYETGADISKTLFGLNLVKAGGVIWIAEGEIDAMYLDQCFRKAHFHNFYGVALGGKTLGVKVIPELKRLEPKLVVLMLDNDDAGRAAQGAVVKQLTGNLRFTEAPYPDTSKDPNSLDLEQILTIANTINERITK